MCSLNTNTHHTITVLSIEVSLETTWLESEQATDSTQLAPNEDVVVTSLLSHTYSELARERKLPVNPPIGAKGNSK